ncbi:hypothetical protein [Bacteroides mediterraneensis]|nr:hypothetical protein [Bacteroides mediterraneensis]
MSDPSGALFNFLKRMRAHRGQPTQFLFGERPSMRKHMVAPHFQHLS